MRNLGLAILALGLTTSAARAQTAGVCSGMWEGTMGLSLSDANGFHMPVSDAVGTTFFGAAECACGETVNAHIELTTVLPPMAAVVELWEGPSCEDYAVRTAPGSPCRKLATPSITDFTASGGGMLDYELPADGPCGLGGDLALIAFTDPQQPFAQCTLPLVSRSEIAPPDAPAASATRAADGSVTVAWTPPTAPGAVVSYQILCADADGNPVASSPASDAAYSVCLPNGAFERRTLDGVADSPDGGGTFAALDHAFLCSPPLDPSADHEVLEGLPNDRALQLIVVAVDSFGDAVPSATVEVAAPQPPARSGCAIPDGRPTSRALAGTLLVPLALLALRWARQTMHS